MYWLNWSSKKFKKGGNLAVGTYFNTRAEAKRYIPIARRKKWGFFPKDAVIKIEKW